MPEKRERLDARQGVDLGRVARHGAGSLVYVAAVVAAIAVVIALSTQMRRRWDLSLGAVNSLSPKTLHVLSGLKEPVTLNALYTNARRDRGAYYDLLTLYTQTSSKIRFEMIDPQARPGFVRDLGVDLSQAGAARDGLTVAVRGERKLVFRSSDEESVTNAILDVGATTPRVVGIARGYGEPDPSDAGDAGWQRAVNDLAAEYYKVREVFLSDPVPDDVTVVAIVGPRRALPPEDVAHLEAWLARGGRLLALLEPGQDAGLGPLLEKYGLHPTGHQVFDRRNNVSGSSEFVVASDYEDHAIVRGFGRNLPTAFPIVGSVTNFETGEPTLFHTALVHSSRYSESVTDEGREQGPFDLAAASWIRVPGSDSAERETRVVLFGDADFTTNAYLAQMANRNLFLNAMGWLARAEGLVTIRRPALEGQAFLLTDPQQAAMRLTFFAPPVVVLLVGIGVFLRRRGR